MPTKKEIRELNQAIKEQIAAGQKLVDIMDEDHEIASVQNGINVAIKCLKRLISDHAVVDPEIIPALRTLIGDIRAFNEANHEELVTIPEGTDTIIAARPAAGSGGSSTSTGSGGEEHPVPSNHTGYNGDARGGAGDGAGGYHAIDDDALHLKLVGTDVHKDGWCPGCTIA